MKFCEDGPEIPDDLLWKRDTGDVVFICGAGVSVPGAGLPDFEALAAKVMDKLHVPDDHNARKILKLSKNKENRGLISIDRVFGEIEHDYYMPEIENAVEEVLHSNMKDDTRYHEIIRDLASTTDGKIRLVTTNFDNLFSQVTNAEEWTWPNLPNSKQLKSLDGLIYLHGRCGRKDKSESRKFVLSTSSFGEAYLASGQARELLKFLLKKYTVVFVGYSADDPPMQYLLEALAQSRTTEDYAYAFHKGEQKEANMKWRHRGIIPLCYKDHEHLWETLELWRSRANDIDAWANSVLAMAQSGPYGLENWQRSQVTHLVSHSIGAEILSKSQEPIPPQWLFVFDSKFRYATPKKRAITNDEVYHDPFDVLGLEEDAVPDYISPDDPLKLRVTPTNAWDAFQISPEDALMSNDKRYYTAFCQRHYSEDALLSERLRYLAVWVGRIAKDPMTLRWATHQVSFHPSVRTQILTLLDRERNNVPPALYRSWEALFEIWDDYEFDCETKLSKLNRKVNALGWNPIRISRYKRLSKPRLVISTQEKVDEIFSSGDISTDLEYIIKFSVEYYGERCSFCASNEYIFDILDVERNNLERAIEIEKSLNRYESRILPITSVITNLDDLRSNSFRGIRLLFIRYYKRFMEAYRICPKRCEYEFKRWPESDTNVFVRLRILISGRTKILTPYNVGTLLTKLSQDIFWDIYHRGDIVNSIKSRWSEFSMSTKKKIGERILNGVERKEDESEEEHERRQAQRILETLVWLRDAGCRFSIDYASTIRRLRRRCKGWKSSSAKNIDKHAELWVERSSVDNTSLSKGGPSARLHLSSTISDSDREGVDENGIIEFIRLCENEPSAAFRRMAAEAKSGNYYEWMWRFWLQLDWNDERCRRHMLRTAFFLCRASSGQVAEMKSSVYDWFHRVAKSFPISWYNMRYRLSLRLLDTLKKCPYACASEIDRIPGRKIDWVLEADNSPVGHFVGGLCECSDIVKYNVSSPPPLHFFDIASELLSLEDDCGRYAFISFVLKIPFLYERFPSWVRVNVINKAKDCDATMREVYLESLSYVVGEIETREIFLEIRDDLTSAFSEQVSMSDQAVSQLSSMIFHSWTTQGDGIRLVSDSQFCDVLTRGSQPLREIVLCHLYIWAKDVLDTNVVTLREVERFFSNVWPLGRFAVSQKTNKYMLEISFLNEHLFTYLTPVILPRLFKANNCCMQLGELSNRDNEIVKKSPGTLLEVLFRYLPENPAHWDYEVGVVLEVIEETAPDLKNDYRLSSLRRKCLV